MFLPNIDQSMVDYSTEEWLETIEERLDYEVWYLDTSIQIDLNSGQFFYLKIYWNWGSKL